MFPCVCHQIPNLTKISDPQEICPGRFFIYVYVYVKIVFNRHEESFRSKGVLHLGFVCTKFLCQYLMSLFGHIFVSIFDVTIWSLKRNPCKSNIFSIYKRIPCTFNIGFLLLKTWGIFMIE